MIKKIPIRNYDMPKAPRIFDVTVDENGNIERYEIQNIKGFLYIDQNEVVRQINEFLKAG